MELLLLILTAAGHIGLELAADGLGGAAPTLNRPQHLYNLAAALAWGAYLAVRWARDPSFGSAVGFRACGFAAAFRASAVFAGAGTAGLLALGAMLGRPLPPASFWVLAAVYPLWGIAQQFALQALITRNLRPLLGPVALRVAVVAAMFALAHFPNYPLMFLSGLGGLGFTWIYERHRNLWAVGIAHGWLGAVAYYCALGQNPGDELLRWIRHA
jgi:hypothetical protein